MNHYQPKVNDYVKWNSYSGLIEGWVYFVDSLYCTIEIGVIAKGEEQNINGTFHRKDHILVVCHSWDWEELEYVKSR